MKLQEFALKALLEDTNISKVVVGCSDMSHVTEAYKIASDGN